jgi:hypothetical protein
MAKAKIKKKVVLELSEYEARTLCEVFQHIGGPPEGPRGDMDKILEAIEEIGIKRLGKKTVDSNNRSLYFK